MLKNLLETWAILAPDELSFNEDRFLLKETERWDEYIDIKTLYLRFEKKAAFLDTLQGYIQRCIERRGWDCDIKCYFGHENLSSGATVWTGANDKVEIDSTLQKSPLEGVLTAYVMALAAQRPVNPGQWQHFKGGVMEVGGVAFQGAIQIVNNKQVPAYDAEFIGTFSLEEVANETVDIYRQKDRYIYIPMATMGMCDRVFYYEKADDLMRKWTRKLDTFLGLVGSEHPEHEGKLRFEETKT